MSLLRCKDGRMLAGPPWAGVKLLSEHAGGIAAPGQHRFHMLQARIE
jgi:hypothetical protein